MAIDEGTVPVHSTSNIYTVLSKLVYDYLGAFRKIYGMALVYQKGPLGVVL
jgi:hypothetical protein